MLNLNSGFQIIANASNLTVNPERIFYLLGYEKEETEGYVSETVSLCIKKCKEALEPKAFVIFKEISKIQTEQGIVYIDDTPLNTKPIIASQLKGAQYAAFFICTIGKTPEILSKQMFEKGDALEGYVLSLAASEAADSMAAFVQSEVKKLAEAQNLGITNRFSPGYCKWDVAEQKQLFALFENNPVEVSINESALMNPIKSVSGFIGIGSNLSVKNYPCKACTESKCLYRDK